MTYHPGAGLFPDRHGESLRAKISLRSADAAWLESISGDLGHGAIIAAGAPFGLESLSNSHEAVRARKTAFRAPVLQ
jgi:hypothetical protein